ncbi:Radical SAM superfamily protein [Candidatus Methanoperedenaceae archaeon GB37]|nr:Radical SAM superfamily protein [Candidatus Methanoperedenaceae archaeon GB37]
MDAEIKARLLSIGSIRIDPSLVKRLRLTIPSAGPGAGEKAIFLRSKGHRVRLGIDPDSRLHGVAEGGMVRVLEDGVEVLRAELEEELIHCPGQAYITISERCIYDCKFCAVPKIAGRVKDTSEIVQMVGKAAETGRLEAISITSGVADSPEEEVRRAVEAVKALRRYGVPIGVSICPTRESTRLLKDAGASEVKYNVETMDREIFREVCGELDLDFILESLREAVRIFGKNRVYSNMLIGLGETDESVKDGVEILTRMGVIPILRAVAINPLRAMDFRGERPTPERILKLARVTKERLERYGLRTGLSETMCLPCGGCDLVPQIDL